MLYNRCTGIYKFGNNTYPRRIRRRSNLGHIFREKSASYGPENMVRGYVMNHHIWHVKILHSTHRVHLYIFFRMAV